jgi:FixJ family two-component response regulator
MRKEPVVFVVDDDSRMCDSVIASAWQRNVPVQCFCSAEEFLDNFDHAQSGCLVVGVQLADVGGSKLQQRLRREGIGLPVIVVGNRDEHGVADAVEAMRDGAIDFLTAPFSDYAIWNSIQKALGPYRGRDHTGLSP